MSLGTKNKTKKKKKEKKKEEKAALVNRYGSTNSVKNIEWWKLGDNAKRVWKIEWWVMSDECWKLSEKKNESKHPLS